MLRPTRDVGRRLDQSEANLLGVTFRSLVVPLNVDDARPRPKDDADVDRHIEISPRRDIVLRPSAAVGPIVQDRMLAALPLRSPIHMVCRQSASAATVRPNAMQRRDRKAAGEGGTGFAEKSVEIKLECHYELHFVLKKVPRGALAKGLRGGNTPAALVGKGTRGSDRLPAVTTPTPARRPAHGDESWVWAAGTAA